MNIRRFIYIVALSIGMGVFAASPEDVNLEDLTFSQMLKSVDLSKEQ